MISSRGRSPYPLRNRTASGQEEYCSADPPGDTDEKGCDPPDDFNSQWRTSFHEEPYYYGAEGDLGMNNLSRGGTRAAFGDAYVAPREPQGQRPRDPHVRRRSRSRESFDSQTGDYDEVYYEGAGDHLHSGVVDARSGVLYEQHQVYSDNQEHNYSSHFENTHYDANIPSENVESSMTQHNVSNFPPPSSIMVLLAMRRF